jgi:hypothetical protein
MTIAKAPKLGMRVRLSYERVTQCLYVYITLTVAATVHIGSSAE